MTATITINCDNAAFTDHTGHELARILRRLADGVEYLDCDSFGTEYNRNLALRDINGNEVGRFTVSAS